MSRSRDGNHAPVTRGKGHTLDAYGEVELEPPRPEQRVEEGMRHTPRKSGQTIAASRAGWDRISLVQCQSTF